MSAQDAFTRIYEIVDSADDGAIPNMADLTEVSAAIERSRVVGVLDAWAAPGTGHNVELASGSNHQAVYLHGWDGEVVAKFMGATFDSARTAAARAIESGEVK